MKNKLTSFTLVQLRFFLLGVSSVITILAILSFTFFAGSIPSSEKSINDFEFKMLPPGPCPGGNSIGGTVFQDLNFDGINNDGIGGYDSICVLLYDLNGFVDSTTTDINGEYYFDVTGMTAGNAWRVEFRIKSNRDYLVSTPSGMNNNTTVQFVDMPSCSVDLGVADPLRFCQPVPQMLVACYENGSGAGNSNGILVNLSYNVSGNGSNNYVVGATANNVGSLWGVAYNRFDTLAYTAAVLKRQIGIGPRGLDGIYVQDMTSGTGTLVGGYDIDGVNPSNGGAPIDLGTITRNLIGSGPGNGDNDLSADRDEASKDIDAFANAGKVGYGDIDIDEINNVLWAVNLKQRAIIAVDLNGLTPSGAIPNTIPDANVRQWLLDDLGAPSCTNGTLRPFALKIHQGVGYLGAVCDAAGSSTIDGPAEQIAYVFSFDLAGPATLNTVVSFPMDYNREMSWVPFVSPPMSHPPDQWQRWFDTWLVSDIKTGPFGFVGAPQPLLADLEFGDDGSIVMGFLDRFTLQQGWANYNAVSADLTIVQAIGHGDILLAYNNGDGTFSLEGPNEDDMNSGLAGDLQNDGPSGMGEFFHGDKYTGFDATHWEIATGGLALRPGSDEVTSVTFDPNDFNSQGIRWYSTTTGDSTRAYLILGGFTSGGGSVENFGKGNGLGDVELLCLPPPVEIGNYVWIDSDQDGIQDPGELPIDGLNVSLYDDMGMLLTTTVTVSGSYIFTDTDIDPDETYFIVFGEGQEFNGNILTPDGSIYALTTNDTGEGSAADENDSDASPNAMFGDLPTIQVLSPLMGSDFTLDAGFFEILPVAIGDTTFIDANSNGIQDGGDVALAGVTVTLYDANADTIVMTDLYGNTITGTEVTDVNGYYLFDSLPSGNYYVTFDMSIITDPTYYDFTEANVSGNTQDGIDSDADTLTTGNPDLGQSGDTGPISAGDSVLTLDAGVVCVVAVSIGSDISSCSTKPIDLTSIGAMVSPPTLSSIATWSTSGTGTFDSNIFNAATSYTFSQADIDAGTVTLTLTADTGGPCGVVMDQIVITILPVDCGRFPWQGN